MRSNGQIISQFQPPGELIGVIQFNGELFIGRFVNNPLLVEISHPKVELHVSVEPEAEN